MRSLTWSRRGEANYRFRTKDRFHIMSPPTARLPKPLEPDPTVVRSGQVSGQPLSLTMVPKHKPAVPRTTQDQFCFEPSTATRITYKPETWSCENQWTALQTAERKRLSVSAGGTNPAADPFCVSIARPALGLCPRISVYMSDISISSNINIIGDR